MNFEQPASLNRYILPPIQFTWAFRWKLFKLFLPITVFCALFITQALLIQAWERDDWGHSLFLRLVIAIGILPVALIFSVELGSRLERKNGKIIRLGENSIRAGPGLAWKQVVAWQFNNLADEKNYRVATIEYKFGPKWGPKKKLRRYSIVLDKLQIAQLISEVKSRRQIDGLSFSISDQTSNFVPKSFELKKGDAAKNYLFFAGAFLLIEGLPFLLAGIGMKDDSPNPDFRPPNPNGSFAKFIRAHFSSIGELRHFLLVTGAVLCGSGLVLIIWAGLLNKKQKVHAS